MSDLISGRAAAKILGISPGTMSHWVANGRLNPESKLGDGHTFLFDRAYIEALAAERKESAQAPAEQAAA